MKVFNEWTKEKDEYLNLIRGVVYQDLNYIEFGYFPYDAITERIYYDGAEHLALVSTKNKEKIFSVLKGENIWIDKNSPKKEEHLNVFGNGAFPYTIEREYAAEKHIDEFEENVELSSITVHPFSKELSHSFGIEFETAAGYLPEDKCFSLGLIPLRDGSITGIEYSTIPMEGNEGLNLLKSQIEELKKYTYSNKECSIHIHFGGFPVNNKAILILHTLWYYLQYDIEKYIPSYSFNTSYFKNNEKNYCNRIMLFNDFKELYSYYVGTSYLGDLYQPHPKDIRKEAKWNVKTRYYNCNFINMLCYDRAKTVEFRFLTPTYSYEKLLTFIFILNGILKYAEEFYTTHKKCIDNTIVSKINKLFNEKDLNIVSLLQQVYSEDVVKWLNDNLKKLKWLKATQCHVGDSYGGRLDIENRYFPDGKQE